MPEWPLDQSYEIAYAKMVPVRLKHVAVIGPGAGSNAAKKKNHDIMRRCRYMDVEDILFSLVRASLSQKLIVPSEPTKIIH